MQGCGHVAKLVQFCSQLISHPQVCNLKSVVQPLVVCQFLLVISISLDKGYSEVQLMPPFNLIDNTAIQSEPVGVFCTVMVLIIVIMNINYNMHWWSACFISIVRRLNLSDCQLVPFSLLTDLVVNCFPLPKTNVLNCVCTLLSSDSSEAVTKNAPPH